MNYGITRDNDLLYIYLRLELIFKRYRLELQLCFEIFLKFFHFWKCTVIVCNWSLRRHLFLQLNNIRVLGCCRVQRVFSFVAFQTARVSQPLKPMPRL